jgi:hypothetical protein
MGIESIGLSDILRDVLAASENMDAHNSETGQRITAVEKSVNELFLRQQRSGREGGGSVVDISARMRPSTAASSTSSRPRKTTA